MPDREISRWRDIASLIPAVREKAVTRPELPELAGIYAGELSRIFDPAGCIIFLSSDDGTSLLVPAGIQGTVGESDYGSDMPLMRQFALAREGIFFGPEQCRISELFPGEKPQSLLCSPVITRDRVSGFIYLFSSEPNALHREDLAMVELIAGELAMVMDFLSLLSSLDAATVRDQLTGCYNRQKFNDDIEIDIPCSERYGRPLSLVKITVDSLKKFHKVHGTARGDELIRKTGETLAYSIRMCDRLYRFSAEEFILILPGIDKERGVFAAQRLLRSLGNLRFDGESESQPNGMITYSIGVASFPVDSVFKDGLIKKLDAALRRAEELGGNTVVSL
ncbi:MAG: GGDEF domain-containing protein [Nitrospirae bacterium]|nr:GGDEF domain-containing protein [Nitrospirota bacterium]